MDTCADRLVFMLSSAERDAVLTAVQRWAEAAPNELVMGFLDGDGLLTADELATAVRDRTEDGESFLEMIEHAVRRDGLDSVVTRFISNANPHMPEVGERFLGTVVRTTTFGAFVSLLPGSDGLLHVTQIRKLHGGRIVNVADVMHIGDKIQVEIREIDDRGKLSVVPVEVVERESGRRGPVQRDGFL